MIDSIKNWFTGDDGFDEHSPSRWSEGVAALVMEGLGRGFDTGLTDALRRARNATDRLKAEFSGFGASVELSASYGGTAGGMGGGVTVNQYIQSVPQTAAELNDQSVAYFQRARWAM